MILRNKILIVVAIAGAYFLSVIIRAHYLEKSASNVVPNVMNLIARPWSIEAMEINGDADIKSIASAQKEKLVYSLDSLFGDYEGQVSEPNCNIVTGTTKSNSIKRQFAYCLSEMKFSKHSSATKLTLVKNEENWVFYDFNIVKY
ncbi:MAG TPA: hypothetical protein VK954_07220 [Methyloradius sp.]|nr:hypothetical protein [Methyloradius sp.]